MPPGPLTTHRGGGGWVVVVSEQAQPELKRQLEKVGLWVRIKEAGMVLTV